MKRMLLAVACLAVLPLACAKEAPAAALVAEARAMLAETTELVAAFGTRLAAATNGTAAAAAIDSHLASLAALAEKGRALEGRFPGWKEAARDTALEAEVRRLREVLGTAGQALGAAESRFANDAAFPQAVARLRQAALPVQK